MNKEDLEGYEEQVHLRPNTKTASAECHRRMPAMVVSVDGWPIVEVRLQGGRTIKVHQQDIGKNPKKAANQDKKEGDTQQGRGTAESNRKLAAFAAVKPMELPEGMEEQTLW